MKRFYILVFILLMALLLVSCNTENPNEPISESIVESDSTQEETANEESEGTITVPILEPEKQDLPSYEDLCKIEAEMNYKDVYAILGNPQRIINKDMPSHQWSSSATPYTFYIYDSTEGKSIWISYSPTSDFTQLYVKYIDITDTDLAQ